MTQARPRLLDLFCGGGGAAMGYHRAGFDVVGVDIHRQRNFPFDFVQADALSLDLDFLTKFDVVHASPPCQRFSRKRASWGRPVKAPSDHPDLLGPVRDRLALTGRPFVLENVPEAPIRPDLMLCGTMFGLRIIKHRAFELSWRAAFLIPCCYHRDIYDPWHGKGRTAAALREALGIDWLPVSGGRDRKAGRTGDLSNAIPPAYTALIGRLALERLDDIAKGKATGR